MSVVRIAVAAAALALLAGAPAQAGWFDGHGGYTKPSKPKPMPSSSTGGTSNGGATKVPEPAGIGLFALGVAGIAIGRLGLRRRRR